MLLGAVVAGGTFAARLSGVVDLGTTPEMLGAVSADTADLGWDGRAGAARPPAGVVAAGLRRPCGYPAVWLVS